MVSEGNTGFHLIIFLLIVCSAEGRSPLVKEFVAKDHKFADCDEVRKFGGYTESGLYTVWLNGDSPVELYCRFEDDITYAAIMAQTYGSQNFTRSWKDYEKGFGFTRYGDFWQGLEVIYKLNIRGYTYLNMTLMDWSGAIATVGYTFHINGGSDKYRAFFSGYNSPNYVPDDLSFNSGHQFATDDEPDPHLCALHTGAGWWYNYCTYALPTGKHYPYPYYTPSSQFYDGLYYDGWNSHKADYSLKYVAMHLGKF